MRMEEMVSVASTPSDARRGLPGMDSAGFTGLTEEEALARLRVEGPNELPSQKKRGLLAIAIEVVREPMFLMLVAAGGLYLVMGEPADALMLLGFVVRGHGDHHHPGATHRARARRAARPVEPARPRHPRRRPAAHPRARGRAGRPRGPRRG